MYKYYLNIALILLLSITAVNSYAYHVVEQGKDVTVSSQKVNLIDDVEIKDGEALSHKQIVKIINSKNSDVANQEL